MAYSHVRLRKFNTAKTYPEQKLDNDLSMSVRAGNFVFLRGQVGQALISGSPNDALSGVTQIWPPQSSRAACIMAGSWLIA